METISLKGNGRIKVVRTEIEVPHAGGIITHVLPLFDPGNYQKVMGNISQEGLLRPTTGQTLSLVALALQNLDEKHCKTILSKLTNQYLWTSTENLYGEKDVIVYDNVNGQMPSDRASLVKRMKDGDETVRAVPYGFQTGSQSVSDLIKNPYIIAQVGNLPLEVVAEIAKKVSEAQSYVYALGSQNRDVKKYTAVYSDWDGDGLSVLGDFGDGHDYGFASGVCKSAEGASQKIK